ncbi:MAG: hypothetical protein EBY32_09825 [Proteobacteria bacterium]|nr:hypothetical protein [Pseudomonadota bacterium]
MLWRVLDGGAIRLRALRLRRDRSASALRGSGVMRGRGGESKRFWALQRVASNLLRVKALKIDD